MGSAKINENGDLVDVDTGETLGNVRDGMSISTDGADSYTLEEAGVSLPEMPDEDELENGIYAKKWARENKEDDQISDDAGKDSSVRRESPAADERRTHIDSGPTSFEAKRTKYEVTKDTFFVIRFGLFQMEDGRFIVIASDDVPKYEGAEAHWVKFRMWRYDEELKWKASCLEYDSKMKGQVINIDKLNERKLKSLLLDWSFGEYEDRLKLLHCDGRLSDESYSLLMGMYPSIVNAIVNLMNDVLENNR